MGNQATGCVDALLAHLDALGNADLVNAIDTVGDTALQLCVTSGSIAMVDVYGKRLHRL